MLCFANKKCPNVLGLSGVMRMYVFKKKVLLGVVFLGGTLSPFYMDKNDSMPCRKGMNLPVTYDMRNHFMIAKPDFKRECIITDPLALQQAVRDAQKFFDRYWKTHKPVIAPQPFSTQVLSANKVRDTLKFIDETIEEDKASGIFRIHDPVFLKQNLGFIAWKPDTAAAAKAGYHEVNGKKIRLTSYVIYRASGNYEKTPDFPCALHRLVNEKKRITLTKQEILAGGLRDGYEEKAEPLVWVARETLEEAMLQGTVLLAMPDGKERAFNVNISNGHRFDRKLRSLAQQKIYWFFLERKNEKSIKQLLDRSHRRTGVVFAGDLYSLGFGKVVGVQYYNAKTEQHELRLGVLGDTGSAFERNLYHLDLFGGIMANKRELKSYLSNFPPTVKAFVVYRK